MSIRCSKNRLTVVSVLCCEQVNKSTQDLQSPIHVDRQINNIGSGRLWTGSSSHAASRGQSDRCWASSGGGGDDGDVVAVWRRKPAAWRWRQRRGAGQVPRSSTSIRPARFILVPATMWDMDRMWSQVHQDDARSRQLRLPGKYPSVTRRV